jgi:hypothetical protein
MESAFFPDHADPENDGHQDIIMEQSPATHSAYEGPSDDVDAMFIDAYVEDTTDALNIGAHESDEVNSGILDDIRAEVQFLTIPRGGGWYWTNRNGQATKYALTGLFETESDFVQFIASKWGAEWRGKYHWYQVGNTVA